MLLYQQFGTWQRLLLSTHLKASVFPNPGSGQFSRNISSSYLQKVSIQVMDLSGKVVETKTGLAPDQTIGLGCRLKAGRYFVELRQEQKKIQLKMVKQ